ncbi:MAG: tetratricopeptide repeat protein [bacterium]|nr:tetratricopeptide repeat protein [bacterium]
MCEKSSSPVRKRAFSNGVKVWGITRVHAHAAGLAVLFVLGLALTWNTAPQSLRNAGEDALYVINPTAARAFAYGERHFNASNSSAYDIARAEYFFKKAAALDPTILYLYHELARIDFLKGRFNAALAKIDFQISMHGDETPNSYYVRGLIEGYMGKYDASAKDYERYLEYDPTNWAALNDYAWVLLKANRPEEAAAATARGLENFPDNPWLLNSQATALYEMGDYAGALVYVQRADAEVRKTTEKQWLVAYPGNDPKIASDGLAAFKKAVSGNMHTIEQSLASSTVQ